MNLARATASALPASHITIIKLELPQQSTRRYDVTLRLCRPLTNYERHEMVAHRSIGLDVSPDDPSQLIATHTTVEEVCDRLPEFHELLCAAAANGHAASPHPRFAGLRDVTAAAADIAQNGVFEHVARAGYVVSGLLHMIIGYLAIQIALGTGGGNADQSGALAALSAKPGGIIALWAAVIALVAMALWRLAETALGRSTDPKRQGNASEVLDRAKAFALAVVYFGFGYATLGFARGAGKSTGAQNSGLSARLMQTSTGTVVLIGGGIIIVAVGGYHIYKGASRNFLNDLKGTPSDLVRRLGLIGYIAKGLVIAGAGVLVIIAATLSEPEKATGLDGALKTLGAQPYGAILLILAGLGIITYGLYSFAMARYTKM